MDMPDAVAALQALAHHGRLSTYSLLAKAGPGGLAAREVSSRLRIGPKTLKVHLVSLSREGLIKARRDGPQPSMQQIQTECRRCLYSWQIAVQLRPRRPQNGVPRSPKARGKL